MSLDHLHARLSDVHSAIQSFDVPLPRPPVIWHDKDNREALPGLRFLREEVRRDCDVLDRVTPPLLHFATSDSTSRLVASPGRRQLLDSVYQRTIPHCRVGRTGPCSSTRRDIPHVFSCKRTGQDKRKSGGIPSENSSQGPDSPCQGRRRCRKRGEVGEGEHVSPISQTASISLLNRRVLGSKMPAS